MRYSLLSASIMAVLSISMTSSDALAYSIIDPGAGLLEGELDNNNNNQNNGMNGILSDFSVTSRNENGVCKVKISQMDDKKLTTGHDQLPLVIAEMTFIDRSSRKILGSEKVISKFRETGIGLIAEAQSVREQHSGVECLVTNVSVAGATYPVMNNSAISGSIFKIATDDLTSGPITNKYIAAPLLARLFISHLNGDFTDIDYQDFRLVKTNNFDAYKELVNMATSGNLGWQGANDAGYSIDFTDLRYHSQINQFLLDSLVRKAVELGIVGDNLENESFADYIRKYILTNLSQNTTYEYGSDDHIKASVALTQSSVMYPSFQMDEGGLVPKLLGNDFLLREFDTYAKEFNAYLEQGKAKPSFSEPDEKTLAIYNLPFNFKTWSGSGQGKVGDLYVYDNPYSGQTDIFRLKSSNYSYFPTNRTSNSHWEFIGPRNWNTYGNSGDIYLYENPYNNAIDLFELKGNYRDYFPTDRTSSDNWKYLDPNSSPLDELVSPDDQFDFIQHAIKFSGLDGVDLAKAVLEQNGNIHIDEMNLIIYSKESGGGLLGKNVLDIAALAFDVEAKDVTRAQTIYTQAAMDAIFIDTLYPYGSLNNVKASIYARIAHESNESSMLDNIGTGVEPFVLDELIANNDQFSNMSFDSLVHDFVGRNFRLNGVIANENFEIETGEAIELFEHGNSGGKSVLIRENEPDLSIFDFDNIASSVNVPAGWEIRVYEGSYYSGSNWTLGSGQRDLPANDRISSIKIMKKPEDQVVTLFDSFYSNSKTLKLSDSTSWLDDFNDKAVKVHIPEGWEVRFYEHGNYTGNYWTRGAGTHTLPVANSVSSLQVLRKSSYANNKPEGTVTVSQVVYDGLVELDKAQQELAEHYAIVTYDNGYPVQTIPLSDELFARAQLFKYGLSAKMVEDLWKSYLKQGFLSRVSDSRITSKHLDNERKTTNKSVQDMWESYFNAIVPIAAKHLSTLIDYKAKLSGFEPMEGKNVRDSKLRIVYGMEVDEHIRSEYFNGIWNNWKSDVNNWLIYGPNIDYSVKTASNIYDFMSLSNISFDKKYKFYNDQSANTAYGSRDIELFEAMNKNHADKWCSKPSWEYGYHDSPTKPGALGLEKIHWQCGLFYITRDNSSDTMKDAYYHIVSEMMKKHKWDLKTVQTNRDTLFAVLQMFIPIWGTVESFEKKDGLGAALGLLGDAMFFTGVASNMDSFLKPNKFVTHKPSKLLGQGAGVIINDLKPTSGALVQVNRVAAKVEAKDIAGAIVKSTLQEMNPAAGLGDLAKGLVKKSAAKQAGSKKIKLMTCPI
ncbi:beta/gamma crystallin family protein [Vibrio sp. SM6]|uniref:Beta/gamma crystallin family protein n=1 Tax=Vibrio agarilyticus TaxID=2726741 RepID=A0A7X8YGV9_9VIBR|nr:beta/gamma crystallin family protein [Vibrio agarilyticus]NLS12757.1 beta/gamma crystallin family protein [Vibrio agarilyticus]